MLKKDMSGKEKQKNIESKKNDFRFTVKNTSHLKRLKEQYPVTAHAPNFDFWTGCPKSKDARRVREA